MKIAYSQRRGRLMCYDGRRITLHWSATMLDTLRRLFPTTKNEELAELLGVSPRTVIRKARELGLTKDPEWLAAVWNERRIWAHVAAKRKGYPGSIQKGERRNPAGEFKPGHRNTPESEARRIAAVKLHNKLHPFARREAASKAWETRRRKMETA